MFRDENTLARESWGGHGGRNTRGEKNTTTSTRGSRQRPLSHSPVIVPGTCSPSATKRSFCPVISLLVAQGERTSVCSNFISARGYNSHPSSIVAPGPNATCLLYSETNSHRRPARTPRPESHAQKKKA